MIELNRFWIGKRPADQAEIDKLKAMVKFDFPAEYLDLLRRCNGGEGPLGLAPLWLQLWSVEEVIEHARRKLPAWRFPGYFFFGSNGALEHMAMRRVDDEHLEIVAIDVSVGRESAQVIATDFATFVSAIGQ